MPCNKCTSLPLHTHSSPCTPPHTRGQTPEPGGGAGTHQLVALGLPLQLLVVVEGEPVQHSVLLLAHSGHGAFLVDLVHVDGLLALQDSTPPVLARLVQAHLRCVGGSVWGRQSGGSGRLPPGPHRGPSF